MIPRVTFGRRRGKFSHMKNLNHFCAFIFAVLLAAGCSNQRPAAPAADASDAVTNQTPMTGNTNEVAVLETSDGEMTVQFWPDVAPNTVENFKKLALSGFYDGTAFHRIIKGFMIQGGDPNTKDLTKEDEYGQGGPGYTVKAEFNSRPHETGVISMARGPDPDSAGSQFFICDAPADNQGMQYLDGKYTAFGKLIKGEDVLEKIADTPVGPNAQGEMSKPRQRVELISVKIVPADSIK
jgi:peptidyl-prolyl cis-trans isomerase B (cyclophilin B)